MLKVPSVLPSPALWPQVLFCDAHPAGTLHPSESEFLRPSSRRTSSHIRKEKGKERREREEKNRKRERENEEEGRVSLAQHSTLALRRGSTSQSPGPSNTKSVKKIKPKVGNQQLPL